MVQAATPGAEVGTGVQVPLLVKMSLTIGELTEIGASTLGFDRNDHVGRGERYRSSGG